MTEHDSNGWGDADARTLFLSGRYSAFLDAVETSDPRAMPPLTRLFAAKALARTNRAPEAIEILQSLSDPETVGIELAAQAALQQTVPSLVLGQDDNARACIETAERLVAASRSAELEAQLRLHQALMAWTKRDFATTEALARSAMSSDHAETLALAGQFLGFVAAGRGRYMEQIAILESALAELDTVRERDLWIEVSILQNISGIINDLYLPAVARRMSDRAEAIEWPNELSVQRHHILRALAYSRSLGSDPFLPFEYLSRAAAFSPTDAWKLVSRLDRIFMIQEMSGDRIVKDFDVPAELRYAEELTQTLDWREVDGEERLALLLLAEIVADQRPKDAGRYLSLYRDLQQTMSPLLMGKSDARVLANESFIEGIVVAANGDTQRGIQLVGNAFEFWDDVGYSWRATRAAIKLYQLSGEERHIEWAFRESRRYPYSWLSDAVSRAGHSKT